MRRVLSEITEREREREREREEGCRRCFSIFYIVVTIVSERWISFSTYDLIKGKINVILIISS